MSKFKVDFTLKQHTPIIHFQSEQSGATLRATELKPKFDKFLLQHVENLPYKKNANGHKSLEYKVTIEPNVSQATTINSRESLFFGNMGDGEEKKYKNFTKTFTIEFFSYSPKLIETITGHFEAFLANTNFGTRQSKGYGSFYIDKHKFNEKLIPHKVYSFSSTNWEKDIKLLYSFLRQGINLPRSKNPFYTKPAIFAYAKSKGWQWDKKSIKEVYFSNVLEQQQNKYKSSDIVHYTSHEKYLLRDLFGLSSSQEWKSYYKTIEKENPFIERFKSPITFKIVDNRVYFWVNETVENFLNQTFLIKAGRGNDTLELSTPSHFDFEEFLDFAIAINLNTHIADTFHETNEFKNLKNMLEEMKASL